MSQNQQVLQHLKAVGNISGLEAADLYRVRDLPKRISELRAAGHEISGEVRRDHLGQRYMRYSVDSVGDHALIAPKKRAEWVNRVSA
jgi:hypothetical protein